MRISSLLFLVLSMEDQLEAKEITRLDRIYIVSLLIMTVLLNELISWVV